MAGTLLHVDARKRITLPNETHIESGEDLELEVLADGRMILTPIVRIPKHQLWLRDPEIDRMLHDYLADPAPRIDLSEPGKLESVRAEMKAARRRSAKDRGGKVDGGQERRS
jgi:hypothetical protein